MKITNDYASASAISLKRLRIGLVLLLLLLTVMLVYRVILLKSTQSELAGIDNEIELAESAFNTYQRLGRSGIVRNYEEMSRRVSLLNRLAPMSGYPPAHILSGLEGLLPNDVLLTQYDQKQGSGSVDIAVASSDSLSLTAFVHNLEAEENFSQVLIVRQSTDGNSLHSYEIRLTLR